MALSPIQVGQAGLVGRCARFLGGFGAQAINAAVPQSQAQQVQATQGATTPGQRKIKLKEVVNQISELEVDAMTTTELKETPRWPKVKGPMGATIATLLDLAWKQPNC